VRLGPVQLRGVAKPIQVFELRGASERRTRLDVSRARGLSKWVGRESKLALRES
jgi:hypothetical protein